MRCHDDGPALALQSQQKIGQAALLRIVEAASWFVQQDDLRICGQDARQSRALLLAAAEVARVPVRQRAQAEPFKERLVGRRIGRHAVPAAGEGQLRRQRVAEQQRARVLRHVADGLDDVIQLRLARIQARDRDLALARLDQSHDLLEQRALARPVAPHQHDELAGVHRQADAPQRRTIIVRVVQVADFHDGATRGRGDAERILVRWHRRVPVSPCPRVPPVGQTTFARTRAPP